MKRILCILFGHKLKAEKWVTSFGIFEVWRVCERCKIQDYLTPDEEL